MDRLTFPTIPEISRFGIVSGFPFFPFFPVPYGEGRENGNGNGKTNPLGNRRGLPEIEREGSK